MHGKEIHESLSKVRIPNRYKMRRKTSWESSDARVHTKDRLRSGSLMVCEANGFRSAAGFLIKSFIFLKNKRKVERSKDI